MILVKGLVEMRVITRNGRLVQILIFSAIWKDLFFILLHVVFHECRHHYFIPKQAHRWQKHVTKATTTTFEY